MPLILAHRGASGHQHENSLAAFREAIRLGADGVELDVHATVDGALLVHHDPELPGLGPIAGLTLQAAASARLPNGEATPTLQQALAALPRMTVWIELKSLPQSADRALLAAIDGSPTPDRCAVHGFDHRIIARLGSQRPDLTRGVLSASYPIDPVGPMLAAGANTLWQAWHLIDSELVAAVHRTGGRLIAWTVNDSVVAQRLAALGVDGLCGNYPERLRTG